MFFLLCSAGVAVMAAKKKHDMTKEQKQTSNDIILTFELARRDKIREQIPL